jgi:hypothetical protein
MVTAAGGPLRREGAPGAATKHSRMPKELASILLRKSVGAMSEGRTRCSSCHRTPLVGETMHVLASERTVCSLCLDRAQARHGEPLRSERVHASERPLAVAPCAEPRAA